MSEEKMTKEKKVVAETKVTEETKLFEEKKNIDPYIAGFIESMAKTNIEKIVKETLEGLSEDTGDSDSYDAESGDEDSEDRPWRPSHTIFEKSSIKQSHVDAMRGRYFRDMKGWMGQHCSCSWSKWSGYLPKLFESRASVSIKQVLGWSAEDISNFSSSTYAWSYNQDGFVKRPKTLGLKCDRITSPRRLVNTFIHQMIPDLLKPDQPIKVAINFKSWSTTRDILSEWGWSSLIYAAKQISGPTATGKDGNSRNSYPISFSEKTTNKQGWVQTYSAAHLQLRNGEIRYNAWNMWSSGYFVETAIFYAGLFWKTFCILQSASSPKGAGSFSILEQNPLD
jgi:hypothetical protein